MSKQPRPRISACIIVRDEEATIRRALASLAGTVDEIVVVDTGSTDGTLGLVQAAGARLVHFTWVDDFSAARNESLRHATGDWILYLDADEELVQPHPAALRKLCASLGESEAGAYLTVHNPVDREGTSEVQGHQWRLARNVPGLHFEGRIHEQLRWPSGAPVIRAAEWHAITLRHSGYINEGDLLLRKAERNRRLLGLSLAEEPEQPAHHFFLGRQYAWERRFDLALPALKRAIELWIAGPRELEGYVPSMFSTAALAALRESQPDTVLEIETATPAEAFSAELLLSAGVACSSLGQIDGAIRRLNRAWQDRSLAIAGGSDPSASSWRPLLALAEIYQALGRLDEAHAAIEQARKFEPSRADLAEFEAQLSRPLVSACMIVRDEEEHLRRWLPLVRQAVDELIVVDTGSKDATASVAAELGAIVHHVAWQDDFSAARNASLQQATGQWVLWIDADDELVLDSPDALRQLCRRLPATVHGCWLSVQSAATENGDPGASLRQWRLFRNDLGLRFRGRVHEQLAAPAELGAISLIEQALVRVRHWGYATSPDTLQGKLRRNRRLLELSIADEPDEPMHHYSLGKQFVWEHDYTAAAEALARARELWQVHGRRPFGYVAPLFAVSACAALNVGRNEQALELEAECPPQSVSSDLLYYAAIACQRLGRPSDAMLRLRRAFSDPAVAQSTETDRATASWRPRLLLAEICSNLGRPEESYRWIMEAVELLPDDQLAVLLSAARLAASRGHEVDAQRICRRLIAGPAPAQIKEQARQIVQGALATHA